MKRVFVAGGTGYLGRPLIERLLNTGYHVRALVRAGSEPKLPQDAEPVYERDAAGYETYVHLIGVPRPSPAKARQFREIDLPEALKSIEAAKQAGAEHFIYVSVAQPAPVMKAYIEVRQECERALAASGMRHTILRPWYVLGPGHWWPYALMPFYQLMEALPGTRESAQRLGLVKHADMIRALDWAVGHPPEDSRRVIDVPGIRELSRAGQIDQS
jgi:uncharacterized protein YbjT (DUF2867 family)